MQAELPGNSGDEAALGADGVHSGHDAKLSDTEQASSMALNTVNKQAARHTTAMNLPDLIRTERHRRGMSQRDLARALGVSPSAVAQWESGAAGVSFLRLVDLCSLFGLRLESFMGPGSPYSGEIVQDAEERALLAAFRELPGEQRATAVRMLRALAAAAPVDPDKPKRRNRPK